MALPDINNVPTVSSAPDFINDHLRTCPEDTLLGIGAAKMENGASFAREAFEQLEKEGW